MTDFVHLHNHTHYSLQDAACTVDTLIAAAVEHKQPAIALTDHGVMYGVSEFYKKAKKSGIKPIIGSEIYIVSQGSRFDKSEKVEGQKKTKHYRHLILLAKNRLSRTSFFLNGHQDLAGAPIKTSKKSSLGLLAILLISGLSSGLSNFNKSKLTIFMFLILLGLI